MIVELHVGQPFHRHCACAALNMSGIQTLSFSLQVVELQWKAYVDKLRESGTLSSTLSVCDVSGSMTGQPMEVRAQLCHAGGLLCQAGCIVPMYLLATCLHFVWGLQQAAEHAGC